MSTKRIIRAEGQKVCAISDFDFFLNNPELYEDFRNYKEIEVPKNAKIKGSKEIDDKAEKPKIGRPPLKTNIEEDK